MSSRLSSQVKLSLKTRNNPEKHVSDKEIETSLENVVAKPFESMHNTEQVGKERMKPKRDIISSKKQFDQSSMEGVEGFLKNGTL